MNSISSRLDKSDYDIYDDFLNITIDGEFLDEMLDRYYPDLHCKGLIPTLLFAIENDDERKIVWERINPKPNSKAICAILMCPDDRDFSCTLIVAEIENIGNSINWNRIGIDVTNNPDPNKVGTDVNWFLEINKHTFSKESYLRLIDDFKHQFEIDKMQWQKQDNPKTTSPKSIHK
ncbi:hypothetical protein [Mucilaginibacter sp.]|uniref:hypothetical protein n=1 Tax=Mucilaginibacter sp. TaxID=1882438 RepID=UPI000CA9670A|nr:hypothetical protein [Mucilaginibacter sp.]PLW88500.1 MAG: hypothetical protein C0154_16380 [Mucilaginibacter sp.]PMP66205.1 MAG: hypothetical protein C0191_01350 [Mucilaginibacter sp.]HEK18937.1 hypothetical protein [Bacteroidota bacterium]